MIPGLKLLLAPDLTGTPKRGQAELRAAEALALAKQTGIPVETVDKHDLNLLCNNRPHEVSGNKTSAKHIDSSA